MTLIVCKNEGYFDEGRARIEMERFKQKHPVEYYQMLKETKEAEMPHLEKL